MTVNDAVDQIKLLEARLGSIEKRLSRIEGNPGSGKPKPGTTLRPNWRQK